MQEKKRVCEFHFKLVWYCASRQTGIAGVIVDTNALWLAAQWTMAIRQNFRESVFVRLNTSEKTVNTEGSSRCSAGSSPALLYFPDPLFCAL